MSQEQFGFSEKVLRKQRLNTRLIKALKISKETKFSRLSRKHTSNQIELF